MRLVCPNCGAVYEVPEDNIPAPGRDVQCSACETTWFFERPLDGEELQPFEKSPRERDADTEAHDTSGETTLRPMQRVKGKSGQSLIAQREKIDPVRLRMLASF